MAALEAGQNPFHPVEDVMLDADALADFNVWPRLEVNPGAHCGLNRTDFRVVHRHGSLAPSDDRYHPWRNQHGEAVVHVKAAEDVSREKGALNDFDSVGPLAPGIGLAWVSLGAQRLIFLA